MSTWRFPRRSALTMLFKQSFLGHSVRKKNINTPLPPHGNPTHEDGYADHFEILGCRWRVAGKRERAVSKNARAQNECRATESASQTGLQRGERYLEEANDDGGG